MCKQCADWGHLNYWCMKALDHAVKHCAWYMKIDQYHEGIHGDDECEMWDPNKTCSRQEIKFSVGY